MGDIQRSLFGGSSQESQSQQTSYNKAYDLLAGSLGGMIGQAGQGSSALAALLGLGGGPAQTEGFDNWRNSTGYQFGLKQGQDAITGSMAAKGLLNSGAAAKSLMKFGQDYASTKFGEYAGLLKDLSGLGLQAGNTVANAGNFSQGTSTSRGTSSNGGFGGVVGTLLAK